MNLDRSRDLFDTSSESKSPIRLSDVPKLPLPRLKLKTNASTRRKSSIRKSSSPKDKVQAKINAWLASTHKPISQDSPPNLDKSGDLFPDSSVNLSPVLLDKPEPSTSKPSIPSPNSVPRSPLKSIQFAGDDDDCIILSPIKTPLRKKRYGTRNIAKKKPEPSPKTQPSPSRSIEFLSPVRPAPSETPPPLLIEKKVGKVLQDSPLSFTFSPPCRKPPRFRIPTRKADLSSQKPCSSSTLASDYSDDSPLPPTQPPPFSELLSTPPPPPIIPVITAEERRALLKPGAVIRNKADRAAMHGAECPCCTGYYDALDLSPASRKQRVNQVSRHRYVDRPMPPTPDHYWELGFPNTQEQIRRGLIRERRHAPAASTSKSKKKLLF